jgi:hypothetical protein
MLAEFILRPDELEIHPFQRRPNTFRFPKRLPPDLTKIIAIEAEDGLVMASDL